MSKCYWMIEGIGINADDLIPHLNVDRCIAFITEQIGKDLDEPIDKDSFDIGDYLYGEVFQNMGDVLCHCDDSDLLTWGDNGDGDHYFYYPPSYPWTRGDNEPQTITEVHDLIIAAVQKITDLTETQIEKMIDDDLYVYGCG